MSKKSFTDANPAMAFISTSKQTEALEAKKSTGIPMKRNPEFIETKSKRVQMLMQPSLYNSIKEKAEVKGVSVNEMMHEILKSHLEQN